MIEFGKTLRAAREAKGYTIGQVAESTRLMSSMVENLENENFSHIAAPIYGRGFVKLYCEAVGLDPKPLVAEFMEIYSGNRDVSIKERPVATPAPAAEPKPIPPAEPEPTAVPAPKPEPVPAPEPEPAPAVLPQPAPYDPLPAEPAPATAPLREPREVQTSLFDLPTDAPAAPKAAPARPPEPEEPKLSRYSTPFREQSPDVKPKLPSFSLPKLPRIPPIVWRSGALLIAALLILWLILAGVKALYNATTGKPTGETAETAERQPSAATAPQKAPAPTVQPVKAVRTPQKVPDLYID